MKPSPSPDYFKALELSKVQHLKSKTYSGKFIRPYRGEIKNIVDRLGCKSILDYGCGKALQYKWVSPQGQTLEEYWGVDVVKYDPAHPSFQKEPSDPVDLVICSHVLGVIPLPDLDWVVDRIYSLANKAAFIVVGVGGTPSLKKQKWRIKNIPSDWSSDQWINLLRDRKTKDIEVHVYVKSHQAELKSIVVVL